MFAVGHVDGPLAGTNTITHNWTPIDSWSDPDSTDNQNLAQSLVMQKADFKALPVTRSFRRYWSNRGLAKQNSIPWADTAIADPMSGLGPTASMTHYYRWTYHRAVGTADSQNP